MIEAGEWVEVLPAPDILATLDEDGAADRLPFMPEMLSACGRRFRVLVRAERTCARGLPPGARPIRRLDDAVVLEGLRCDGAAHGGCQLGCMLFWKERWVRRVDGAGDAAAPTAAGPQPALRVHQPSDPGAYWCQGTELKRATRPEAPPWSPGQYLRMMRVRTLTPPQLAGMYLHAAVDRARRAVLLRGRERPAPLPSGEEVLGLQPGEWVEVKRREEIFATLDARGSLRGLGFINDYDAFCGRRLRVHARVERIVDEATGRLRRLRDTVALEGADCERHAGCARGMPALWREAWLRRAPPPRP